MFKLSVITNCDDVLLAWDPGQDIPGCIGFSIERKLNGKVATLENRVGFDASPLKQPAYSIDYPFQRLTWTDHGANCGDTVSYRVTARVGAQGKLADGPSSSWTKVITLTSRYGNTEAHFNRGVVLSQFMGRIMAERGWSVGDIKTHVQEVDDRVRNFLSGDLRQALLKLIDDAIADSNTILHAALFELTDDELITKLTKLGKRLNIVLANGAVKHKGEDENERARNQLRDAKAYVVDRMCAPTFLGHNKFVVVSRNEKPAKVWTGSTNWQPTGLCTQANNGILIDDASLAQCYINAWNRLANAGDTKGGDLSTGNNVDPPDVHSLSDGSFAFAQFTSVPQKPQAIDMKELLDLIAGAKQSLLFAMFMPGADIFNAAVGRGKDIYVRGVANTFPRQGRDTDNVDVDLVNDGAAAARFRLQVVEPDGIGEPFAAWVEEVTRRQFSAIGHAIIHSKVLVIDAFGENPTVVTGSHNFSTTASKANDENFVVISGNQLLAQAYAVNVLGLYDHYRWRQHVSDSQQAGKKPWDHLTQDPDWLKRYRASPERKALLAGLGVAK